jgi:hypothetical protein
MDFSFIAALALLGRNAAFRIANGVRPSARYLFATLLPELMKNSYYIESANMTVRATMAGLVGMDSPYPPGGMIEIGTFLERSAKIAIQVGLTERALRELQELLMRAAARGGNTNQLLAQEALNFLNKVIIQAQMDRSEWLRAQALVYGSIDWAFNGKSLTVDYGIPAANKLTTRTGNDAYGGSTSKFWTDVSAARRLLRYNMRALITNSSTIDVIINNDANAVEVLSQTNSQVEIRRLVDRGGNTIPSSDARERITIVAYDEEGEVLDTSNPGETITVPFVADGRMVAIGNNTRDEYRVGEGSTDDPNADLALGYTHMAPTVESGGQPGRWADLYVPQDTPWQLIGRGVSNELPVLTAPEKVVHLSSAMPE